MKKIALVFVLCMPLFLFGCDENDKNNVVISTDNGWYINTSESVDVSAYNGYKLIKSVKVENKDGSIDIALKFDKPINN